MLKVTLKYSIVVCPKCHSLGTVNYPIKGGLNCKSCGRSTTPTKLCVLREGLTSREASVEIKSLKLKRGLA